MTGASGNPFDLDALFELLDLGQPGRGSRTSLTPPPQVRADCSGSGCKAKISLTLGPTVLRRICGASGLLLRCPRCRSEYRIRLSITRA